MTKTVQISDETYSLLQNHQISGETLEEVIKRLLLVVLKTDMTGKPKTTECDIQKYNKYYDETNSGYIR